MIQSMTGFGRSRVDGEGVAFEIEVRSVNHRHLDLRIRLPRELGGLESELREQIARRFARGKLDLSVSVPEGMSARPQVEVDSELVSRYAQIAREIKQEHAIAGELDLATLISLPGVLRSAESALVEDEVRPVLLPAVNEALAALAAMRETEGRALEGDLCGRLAKIGELVTQIEARAEEVVAMVKERLARRAAELAREVGPLDEARLHQEVVLAADRLDITEETVRLRSHVLQFESTLQAAAPGTPVGRKLDFLLQEMGREVNTIGSKGNDASVAHFVVEVKTEFERIREQVQNIE